MTRLGDELKLQIGGLARYGDSSIGHQALDLTGHRPGGPAGGGAS